MRRLFKFIFKAIFYLFIFSIAQVVIHKWVPVWYTPLTIKRSIEYFNDNQFKSRKKWVPIEQISQNMIKSVIASEDNLFETHNGFDWKEIQRVLESAKKGKKIRGCSTISQQTAKNVFTLGDRSYFRKAVEAYYTVLIELIWDKKRIMEVYLNVAEMGKGIYGAEAAARYWYNKPASKLTLYESAAITACLPDPIKRSPLRETKYMTTRTSQIVNLIPKLSFEFLKEWGL